MFQIQKISGSQINFLLKKPTNFIDAQFQFRKHIAHFFTKYKDVYHFNCENQFHFYHPAHTWEGCGYYLKGELILGYAEIFSTDFAFYSFDEVYFEIVRTDNNNTFSNSRTENLIGIHF